MTKSCNIIFYRENRMYSAFPLSLLIKTGFYYLHFRKVSSYFTPLVTTMHSVLVSLEIIRTRWIRHAKMWFAGMQKHMFSPTDMLAIFGATLGPCPVNIGISIYSLLCNSNYICCIFKYNYWGPVGTRQYSKCFRYSSEWDWKEKKKNACRQGAYILMAGDIKW